MASSHNKSYFTLRSARVQLKENPLHRNDKLGYLLPLYSERVHTIYNEERYLLSLHSQRQLRHCLEGEVMLKYRRVEDVMKMKLLKIFYDRWNRSFCRKPRARGRYYYPEVYEVPDQALIRRALQTLFVNLWYQWKKRLHKAYLHWKFLYSQERYIMARFYDKWSVKISLWKLNRLNGQRYLKLMRNYALKVRRVRIASAFNFWKKSLMLWRSLIMVRLIFRCWKFTMLQNKKLRRKFMKEGLNALLEHRRFWTEYREQMLEKLELSINTRIKRRTMRRWYISLRRKIVLKRLFMLLSDKVWLIAAWNKWKFGMPKKLMTPIPKTPTKSDYQPEVILSTKKTRKAAYQGPDGNIVYKHVYEVRKGHRHCTNPFCSSSHLYCSSGNGSPPRYSVTKVPINPTSLSLRQKIKWRMGVLKDMNEEFGERESFRQSATKERR